MPRQTPQSNQALEQILQHPFQNQTLLTQAVTHKSRSHESSTATPHNEKLEFLGDAVLGLLAAEILYERFPQSSEGELTRFRSTVVSRKHLGVVAARLHLGRHLHLGQSVAENGGHANPGIASNALEAVIAAIYLDAGLPAARTFVEREVFHEAIFTPGDTTIELAARAATRDHKTTLQELLQARAQPRPSYRLLAESGPDHQRLFTIEVILPAAQTAQGQGPTKKSAEQAAAAAALELLHG